MDKINLNSPVENLPFVGPTYAKRLEKLGIFTIEDLINHFPFRYDDFSLISPIARVQAGEAVTIKAKLLNIKNEYTKMGKKIQKATVTDLSGETEIIWFNQPYLVKTIKVGETYQFSGKADWFGRKIILVSPEYEKCQSTVNSLQYTASLHTGRLVPIYPETYGISSKWLRTRIKSALQLSGNQIEEFLPTQIILKENLIPEKQAIFKIHFPENKAAAEKAKQRLAFDELFLIQLSALKRKQEWQKINLGHRFKIDQEKLIKFISTLPFELTNAQKKVIKEITSDLALEKPMNRLLQGDVGSGKTVIAAIAMYIAFLNGLSSVLMAPTEILASQHYQTLTTLLSSSGIKVELITSSHKKQLTTCPAGRRVNNSQLAIFVGTHALLYNKLVSENVGLVVIDEQHRFGVEQRAKLVQKGKSPHLLTMTATPIPRTITLTLFGDLDFSCLDEMPKGRQKIKTWVVPPQKRQDAYKWIRTHVKGTKEQAFIICPLIEESETLGSVKAATSEFEYLRKIIFPDLRLGLLHGRLKIKEKDNVLQDFRKGELDILVATPVVEVGIDIPNATIMMIEGAERFGLAQLHQLRGRVGRSNLESYCLLFTENQNPLVIKRLKFLETNFIGMEIAEFDLKLRGPGEIYGTKQHGFPDLRVASFGDLNLIEHTRHAANILITNYQLLITNPISPLNKKLQKYKINEVISN